MMRHSPAFITVGTGPGLQLSVGMVGVVGESEPEQAARSPARTENGTAKRWYDRITGVTPDRRLVQGRACKIRHDNGF
jgi:hypothetical protein